MFKSQLHLLYQSLNSKFRQSGWYKGIPRLGFPLFYPHESSSRSTRRFDRPGAVSFIFASADGRRIG